MRAFSLISIIVALLVSSFVWTSSTSNRSSEKGIQFENITFEEAIAKAKKENKLIFVDAYAVWCGPCKLMDRTTFRSDKVGEVFNKEFINLKIDMEKGEGIELARKYQVRAYPTLMLINGEGKVVKRMLGALSEAQLLNEVQEVIK